MMRFMQHFETSISKSGQRQEKTKVNTGEIAVTNMVTSCKLVDSMGVPDRQEHCFSLHFLSWLQMMFVACCITCGSITFPKCHGQDMNLIRET